MELKELVNKLCLQQEVIDKILPLVEANKKEYEVYIEGLLSKDMAENTYQILSEKYKEDTKNFHILAIYLLTCLRVYDLYVLKGIEEKIFIDTMKCFSRFIQERKVKTNEYYFDRTWWTYRQTSMVEFRIGELEYELDYNAKCINIHVPSDAILSTERIKESIDKAKEFFDINYKDFSGCDFVISSWLLSPRLKKHLSSNSNILKFQEFFEIISFNEEDNSVLEWVFKINSIDDYNKLKEDTSLQRSIKKDLINGYKIGSAYAKLKI